MSPYAQVHDPARLWAPNEKMQELRRIGAVRQLLRNRTEPKRWYYDNYADNPFSLMGSTICPLDLDGRPVSNVEYCDARTNIGILNIRGYGVHSNALVRISLGGVVWFVSDALTYQRLLNLLPEEFHKFVWDPSRSDDNGESDEFARWAVWEQSGRV